jgi:transposase
MSEIKVIGLDLAKHKFHFVACNQSYKIIKKRMLNRTEVLAYFQQLPRTRVVIEACGGAHYWARKIRALGFQVRLIPPQHVKPFVRGNKNDYNDALAIAEAGDRDEMRFVSIKSIEQQDIQAIHRMRTLRVKSRTALCNQTRGLLGEYGIILPQGVNILRSRLPEIIADEDNGLSFEFRSLLRSNFDDLLSLDEKIKGYEVDIKRVIHDNETCQRMQTIPGIGPITASALYGIMGNGSDYRRGRDLSAALGLVPRQHSSGGKDRLLGISKRGNSYVRTLLVHGARSVMRLCPSKTDPLSRWAINLAERQHQNKVIVAIANKMARMAWAVVVNETDYKVVEVAK